LVLDADTFDDAFDDLSSSSNDVWVDHVFNYKLSGVDNDNRDSNGNNNLPQEDYDDSSNENNAGSFGIDDDDFDLVLDADTFDDAFDNYDNVPSSGNDDQSLNDNKYRTRNSYNTKRIKLSPSHVQRNRQRQHHGQPHKNSARRRRLQSETWVDHIMAYQAGQASSTTENDFPEQLVSQKNDGNDDLMHWTDSVYGDNDAINEFPSVTSPQYTSSSDANKYTADNDNNSANSKDQQNSWVDHIMDYINGDTDSIDGMLSSDPTARPSDPPVRPSSPPVRPSNPPVNPSNSPIRRSNLPTQQELPPQEDDNDDVASFLDDPFDDAPFDDYTFDTVPEDEAQLSLPTTQPLTKSPMATTSSPSKPKVPTLKPTRPIEVYRPDLPSDFPLPTQTKLPTTSPSTVQPTPLSLFIQTKLPSISLSTMLPTFPLPTETKLPSIPPSTMLPSFPLPIETKLPSIPPSTMPPTFSLKMTGLPIDTMPPTPTITSDGSLSPSLTKTTPSTSSPSNDISLGMTVQFVHCSFVDNKNDNSVILNQNGAVVTENSVFDENRAKTIIRTTNDGFLSADSTCFRGNIYTDSGVVHLSDSSTLFWKETNHGLENNNNYPNSDNCDGAYQEPVCNSDDVNSFYNDDDDEVVCYGYCSPFLSRECNALLFLDLMEQDQQYYSDEPLPKDQAVAIDTGEDGTFTPQQRSIDKSRGYSISSSSYNMLVLFFLSFFLVLS